MIARLLGVVLEAAHAYGDRCKVIYCVFAYLIMIYVYYYL